MPLNRPFQAKSPSSKAARILWCTSPDVGSLTYETRWVRAHVSAAQHHSDVCQRMPGGSKDTQYSLFLTSKYDML
jgi:hypothetical protein